MRMGQTLTKTLRMVEVVRLRRAENATLAAIAAELGCTKQRVWQLVKRFEISGGRRYGPRPQLVVVPLDPHIAARRTAQKRWYWQQMERGA